MKSSFFLKVLVLLQLLNISKSEGQTMIWKETATGVWKADAGTPESIDLLKASGAKPVIEALGRMPATTFPILESGISLKIVDGKTLIRFPLERGEQIFGFGLNFKTVHQRGKILNLHVDHYGGTDNGRTHAPVPFYVSSQGFRNAI